MSTITTPLGEAEWVYRNIEQHDRQQRFDAATSLGEWGVFSLRQIAAIVGLSHTTVHRLVKPKTARTGGTFDPECLTPLLDIATRRRRNEPVQPGELRAMLSAGSGTTAYVAAKLSGLSEMWIRRTSRKEDQDERGTDSPADAPVAA